jgi:hypothetical protein
LLTLVDHLLRREAAQFDLRFTCERCAHFEEENRSCAEGYPNGPHLEDRIVPGKSLLFCKSFELV